MADQIAIRLESLSANEGGRLPVVVNFRDRLTGTASVPTTAEYKIFDVENEQTITDWTSMGTPAARMTLTLDKDDLSIDQARSRVEFSRSSDSRRMLKQRMFRVKNIADFTS